MAQLLQKGVPGTSATIIPNKECIEPDWLYNHRIFLVQSGKTEEANAIKAVLRQAFYDLKAYIPEPETLIQQYDTRL